MKMIARKPRFVAEQYTANAAEVFPVLAQATRLLPNLAVVLGWESCDHTGPVHEGDTLYSDLAIESAVALPAGRGGVLGLRSVGYAVGADGGDDRQVLDWRFTALMF